MNSSGRSARRVSCCVAMTVALLLAATLMAVGAGDLTRLPGSGEQVGAAYQPEITYMGQVQQGVLLGPERVMTAVRNGSQKLQLILWEIDAAGNAARRTSRWSSDVIGFGEIALTGLTTTRAVTAHTDSYTGRAVFTVWDVAADNAISEVDSALGAYVYNDDISHGRLLALAPLGATRFVSAVYLGFEVRLTVWDVVSGKLVAKSSVDTDMCWDMALGWLSTDRVITALSTYSGQKLQLKVWNIDASGTIQGAQSYVENRQVGDLSIATDLTHRVVTTYSREEAAQNGRIEVIFWEIGGSGQIVRLGDSGTQVGEGDETACAFLPYGNDDRFLIAVRSASNQLVVIAWTISSGGQVLTRTDAVNISGAYLSPTPSMIFLDGNRVATGAVLQYAGDDQEKLFVDVWQVD